MECKRTVLVVDDDDDIRITLEGILANDGYQVTTAKNGAEAIHLLHDAPPPCVVVLDLMMPVMSGWELLDQMRAEAGLAQVPVVVTSAAADRSPTDVSCILPKPLDLDALTHVVAEHCASRARAEAEQARAATERALRELARRNLELQELQRFRDDMSTLIVHDMKTPLAVVVQTLDYVLDGPLGEDEEDKRDALLGVRSAAGRLKRLVESLLDAVKLEGGKLKPNIVSIPAPDLMEMVLASRRFDARERGCALSTRGLDGLLLRADVDLLCRVMENIVDNAMRYTPRGGRVEIWAKPTEGGVVIFIGNVGSTIPPSERERIFDKFGQGSEGAGRTNLGLGLYFCRLAVEAHGGRIWVDSSDALPTIFAIELPS